MAGLQGFKKADPEPHRDYRKMEWDTFLILREWAQEVANLEGYPVYLVGSVLMKLYPRDIDVTMIMPIEDFEKRFGPSPEDESKMVAYSAVATAEWYRQNNYHMEIQLRLRWITRIDVKVMPDTWFTNRDKLLLASPGGKILFSPPWDPLVRYYPEDYSI